MGTSAIPLSGLSLSAQNLLAQGIDKSDHPMPVLIQLTKQPTEGDHMNDHKTINAIDALKTKTHDELALLIAGWNGALQDGFTLEDWEEAMAMAKVSRLIDGDPMLSITYQLLIIYRRYRDAEKRSVTASTTHSPTQTER